jgi:polyhydroxyalkanoate synthesis regulator phasin
MRDDLRRMALFTSGLAEVTRNRAEDLVRGWTRSGDTTREQAQTMARDLIEWSRQNRRELTAFVRGEIETQMVSFGVATRRDVERLERRVARLEKALASKSKTARKTASGKTSARKTSGRKTSARKTSGRKTAARRTAAGKSSGGGAATPRTSPGSSPRGGTS